MRITAILAMLALTMTVAEAASRLGGSQGLNFSCDVNTGVCKCDGRWEGADCKGMLPNCKLTDSTGDIWKNCDIGKGCQCRMFMTAPKQKPGFRQPLQKIN
ncbi:hypothetical protein GGD55_006246 [Rhizobium giardinii]|uniref:EGF-like domain-containing protein n=1 Tax=Rhizobium giardinii TaxID=56731 RepID=A0A7W8XC72_9HYPH|nr:hypothetical protein [Rhizobium giardinii]